MTIYPDSPEGIILKEIPELLASQKSHDNLGAIVCADYLEVYYGESEYIDMLRNSAQKIAKNNNRLETVSSGEANLWNRTRVRLENSGSRFRGLDKPRILGMFATAAIIATTQGLQDKDYVRLSLGAAQKVAGECGERKYLSADLSVPFCESRLKNKVDPRVESAFAMEPFVALQEELNSHLPEWSRESFRKDYKKLVEHCHHLLEREQFKPKAV